MRIAIIHEGHCDLWTSTYGMRAIGEAWRAEGHTVFVVEPRGKFAPADLAVLHVDRTVVPGPHLALARRYPRVVNGRVRDIGKRSFAGAPAADRDFPGPVIVKTARNCGGEPELGALVRRGGLMGLAARVLWRLPPQLSGRLDPQDYPIYGSGRAVPAWFFFDPRFVVQRYLPERWNGGAIALRRWSFFGDREMHSLTVQEGPTVKSGTLGERTPLGPVPGELQALRRRHGFDYGKFDYGIADGNVVVYDLNRTPSGGRLAAGELAQFGRALAPGLAALMGG
jgi:hypothetical protein